MNVILLNQLQFFFYSKSMNTVSIFEFMISDFNARGNIVYMNFFLAIDKIYI